MCAQRFSEAYCAAFLAIFVTAIATSMTIQRKLITPLIFCIVGNIVAFILAYSENGGVTITSLQIFTGVSLLSLIVRIIRGPLNDEKQ
jgi:hypothetical protein